MKNKIAGMVFLGCVCMKCKAAAAPVEQYDSYTVAGTAKLPWRDYWVMGVTAAVSGSLRRWKEKTQ